MQRQQEALLGIHREFEDSGISFAYPTRTLFVEGNQAEAPEDTGYMNRN